MPVDEILDRGWMTRRTDVDGSGDPDLLDVVTSVPLSGVTRWGISQRHRIGPREMRIRRVSRDDFDREVARVHRSELLEEIGEGLARRHPARSARSGLTRWQLALPPVLLGVAAVAVVARPAVALTALTLLASAVLGAVMISRLVAVALGGAKRLWWHSGRRRQVLPEVPDDELPLYTILVPVFHEANIVGRLIENLSRIDYPRDRLEVLVLLEEDDHATIGAALAAEPPAYMRIVVVPRGHPQTKPRACNYGLLFARGRYLVIYDAEDRPEPDQLRRVVAQFRTAEAEAGGRPLAVVQCALSYFNAGYNVLTRLFAIEYAFLFDALLPGIDGTGLPIPLGGTSNHFDTAILRRLGGWDPYNVTEDADLGMRSGALGYRVGVNTSTTWEEACSRSGAFVKQRTRWIKGYLVTSAVNLRHPVLFTRATGLRGLLCLLALVLGTPLAFLAYPFMLVASLLTLTGVTWAPAEGPPWLATAQLCASLVATGATIAASALVALPRYGWRVAAFAVFSPVYWVLHAVAAWRAAWQTMVRPHVWEKTPHGLSDDIEADVLLG